MTTRIKALLGMLLMIGAAVCLLGALANMFADPMDAQTQYLNHRRVVAYLIAGLGFLFGFIKVARMEVLKSSPSNRGMRSFRLYRARRGISSDEGNEGR